MAFWGYPNSTSQQLSNNTSSPTAIGVALPQYIGVALPQYIGVALLQYITPVHMMTLLIYHQHKLAPHGDTTSQRNYFRKQKLIPDL